VRHVFNSWIGSQIKARTEKEIRAKFEGEIEQTEKKLIDSKAKQLANIQKVFQRSLNENTTSLTASVIKAWFGIITDRKHEEEAQRQLEIINAKMKGYGDAQMANTKKVMMRMAQGNDAAMVEMSYQSWIKFCDEEKKAREIDAAAKLKEQQIKEYLQKKKGDAKGILNRMIMGNNGTLMEHVFKTWMQDFQEEKESKAVENQKAQAMKKFQNMNGKQKQNAHGVAARCIEQMDLNCMLRHFCAWGLDAKLERVMKHYNRKMEGKRQQLQRVQCLFQNFSSELDAGLRPTGR